VSKLILATALVANALLGVTLAASQEATEVFIPIGQSPGVSKRQSVMGTVDSVDEKGRSLQIATPSGPVTVVVAEKTRIFRDQSQLKLRNEVGTFADIRKGRTVEVKLVPGEGKRTAEWIKVQITEAGR
jgi:hypothetical protein